MGIIGEDPFYLLVNQQSMIGSPLAAEAATGSSPLDVPQRSISIGEPIPVVFCRRVGTRGGVLISPGATEARFENDGSNAVTAFYRMPLSEGRIDGIQVRDVFQRSCRVGSFTQAYSARAGAWEPGNFIVQLFGYQKPECPYYCGTGGSYDDMTVGSFQVKTPNGVDQWNRQVHLFIRGGIHVYRLADQQAGPSSNFVDLLLWMLNRSARIPDALIDVGRLTSAVKFTEAMGFWFDGIVDRSGNLEDFIANHAKYFLLMKTRTGGLFGLRPLLPVTADGLISTGPITPKHVIDENMIKPGSVEMTFIPLAERKPFCALMLWRQQPEDDVGIVRTTEVRYAGTALYGPNEQHDMSSFCTSELHAVRVGAYMLARRRYVTHTLRIGIKPGSLASGISRRDIVQVQFNRKSSIASPAVHSKFYEVTGIRRSRDGGVSLDLTHFPVDEERRSMVAIDVMSATARGLVVPTGKSALVTCDTNSRTDTTVPPEVTTDPVLPSGDGGGQDFEAGDIRDGEDGLIITGPPADGSTGDGGGDGGAGGGAGGGTGGGGDGGGGGAGGGAGGGSGGGPGGAGGTGGSGSGGTGGGTGGAGGIGGGGTGGGSSRGSVITGGSGWDTGFGGSWSGSSGDKPGTGGAGGGAGGVGGIGSGSSGSAKPAAPGTNPSTDPNPPPVPTPPPSRLDIQTPPPDVSVPPTGIPIGGSAPAGWVDAYNQRLTNNPDTPWPTDWGEYPGWNLVFRFTSYPYETQVLNGGGSVASYTELVTVPGASGPISVMSGYITDLANIVTVWPPRIIAGDILGGTVIYPSYSFWARFDTTAPYFVRFVTYPKPPIIRLVDAVRAA